MANKTNAVDSELPPIKRTPKITKEVFNAKKLCD